MVKPPLRTKTLSTKVSQEEFGQLEAAASERGLTPSEWCRETLLASVNGQEAKLVENGFYHGISSSCSATTMPKFWRLAAECLFASLALTSVTVVCYRLHFNLAANALLLMIFVVLTARLGSFFSSIFASIVAALCLTYMVPPAFSFRVTDPLDGVAINCFLEHFLHHRSPDDHGAQSGGRGAVQRCNRGLI